MWWALPGSRVLCGGGRGPTKKGVAILTDNLVNVQDVFYCFSSIPCLLIFIFYFLSGL